MRKLWIDTDAGVDDSTAILLCLACPSVEVVGISCVGGNASLENVFRNVKRTINAFGNGKENIPVYCGESHALKEPPMHIPEIHGKDGLGDISSDEFSIPDQYEVPEKHAVDALIDAVSSYTDLEVLCLGPLTNIAKAISKSDLSSVKHWFIMGGAEDCVGNTSQWAEFNFAADPEAAHIVFNTIDQRKITVATWTLSAKHMISSEEELHFVIGRTDTYLQRWLNKTWKSIYTFLKDKIVMADPIAAFVTLYPEHITSSIKAKMDIVLNGEKRGMSPVVESPDGCTIPKSIDHKKYLEALDALMSLK